MKTALLLAVAALCGAAFADKCDDAKSCCQKPKMSSADAEFLAEAQRMALAAEGKKECCRSTATHVVLEGEKGCCGAKGQPAKFKVFVSNEGYKYFGCEDSAAQGRNKLQASGKKVGGIQAVTSKVVL